MSTLLDECLECLGKEVLIFTEQNAKNITDKMFEHFKFGTHGVDWKSYEKSFEVDSLNKVIEILENLDCYIVWDEYTLPILKSNINAIRTCIDDVTAVSFDTYLVDINFNWLIEFHHEEYPYRIRGVIKPYSSSSQNKKL
jgi:hypothetical protein